MPRAGATLLLGLAGALLLHAVAPALAHDVSGEIAALEEHIKDLQVNEMVLQSDIREAGGSATAHIGIAGAQARIDHDEMQIQTLDASAITGELRQTYLMDPRSDPSGCTMVAGEGMGTIGFRLVPARP